MSGRVILVRHGETKFNKGTSGDPGASAERIRGWCDVPLDPTGMRQAIAIATRLKDRGIARVYCSNLKRALETGYEIARQSDCGIHATQSLRPWNLGDYTRQLVSDVLADIKRYTKDSSKPVPGGESFDSFRQRYLSYLTILLEEAASKNLTLCVVTHTRNTQCARAWAAKGFPTNLTIDDATMDDYEHETPTGGFLELTVGGGNTAKEETRKPIPLPPDHRPLMRVPKGGSSCASCRYLTGTKSCGNRNYRTYYGTTDLPGDPNELCSDWWEPRT